MHDDLIEISNHPQVILIGRHPVLYHLSKQSKAACGKMPISLVTNQSSMHQLRHYVSATDGNHSLVHVSDHDTVRLIEQKIEHGQIFLVALPAMRAEQVRPNLPIASAPPALASSSKTRAGLNVKQLTSEQRISEVIKRAATKVPKTLQTALLSLLSEENIKLLVVILGIVGAANLTPYGWAGDLFALAVGYYYGGKAAIQALQDLTECFRKTANATSDADLEAASTALARAVTTLSVLGLIAVLHEIRGNKGTTVATRALTPREIAQEFFSKESKLTDAEVQQNMNAIDFDKPVERILVRAGTRLYRLEKPGAGQGKWYSDDPTFTASQRGIASHGDDGPTEWEVEDFKGATPRFVQPPKVEKIEGEYLVTKDTFMLKSTAKKGFVDNFSLGGGGGSGGMAPKKPLPIPTRGGAVQYFFNHRIDTNR